MGEGFRRPLSPLIRASPSSPGCSRWRWAWLPVAARRHRLHRRRRWRPACWRSRRRSTSSRPRTIAVPSGVVHFAVSNVGDLDHEFEVLSGEASLGKIDTFSRGTTKDLTVTLEPGSYTFICRLNGHDQLGMSGTLTVTGG